MQGALIKIPRYALTSLTTAPHQKTVGIKGRTIGPSLGYITGLQATIFG